MTSNIFGELIYNEELEQYEGEYFNNEICFDVEFYRIEAGQLDSVVKYAETQIQKEYYAPMLLKMEEEMVKLKNEHWLETGETPITAEQLREEVSITDIMFENDCSSIIWCVTEGDVFGDHAICIYVDKDGIYKSSGLEG